MSLLGVGLGFVLGIPSGYIANCLYGKRHKKKAVAVARWSWTYEGGAVHYEGPANATGPSSLADVIKVIGAQQSDQQRLPPGPAGPSN
jgi:hypothetical protein